MDLFGIDKDVSRIRQIVYETVERLNGARFVVEIKDNKIEVTMTLPPVSPPAVNEQ